MHDSFSITPELQEWARRQADAVDEKEVLAALAELKAGGGSELAGFIDELEKAVQERERPPA